MEMECRTLLASRAVPAPSKSTAKQQQQQQQSRSSPTSTPPPAGLTSPVKQGGADTGLLPDRRLADRPWLAISSQQLQLAPVFSTIEVERLEQFHLLFPPQTTPLWVLSPMSDICR
ncbi:hypothetical protein PABG_11320 [Paracoccidioides brasiliensis Pb03]|nr:hypothetical protein PABG_11320 [Paracoccidioides brasiliensis Pb03]